MNRRWWALGVTVEVIHVIFVISVLILGRRWLPGYIVNLAIAVTVMGQIIFLWCPLSVLSAYCFRRADPGYRYNPSPTLYLYRRFGRKIGIPIFILLVALSTFVGVSSI